MMVRFSLRQNQVLPECDVMQFGRSVPESTELHPERL